MGQVRDGGLSAMTTASSGKAASLAVPHHRGKIPLRPMLIGTLRGFFRHDCITESAALAFFFLTSLFPFLIFLASALALLPIHHMADRITELASSFIPAQNMPMAQSIVSAALDSNKKLLSLGFAGAVIFASSGFGSMIAALNRTYEVAETRSFWRVRLRAIWMTFVLGGLVAVALSVMLLGPRFGMHLADAIDVSDLFVVVWPYLRWIVILTCGVLSIDLLYYWGPNRKQSFAEQIPGTIFAAPDCVIISSYLHR